MVKALVERWDGVSAKYGKGVVECEFFWVLWVSVPKWHDTEWLSSSPSDSTLCKRDCAGSKQGERRGLMASPLKS